MLFFYLAISSFILSTLYFFVLPLSKKRPVLIGQWGIVIYSLSFFGMLPYMDLFFATILVMIIFVIIFKISFIYGITKKMVLDALLRAASATRSPIEEIGGVVTIDNSSRVTACKITKNISLLIYKKTGKSKKAKLADIIFGKFINNYLIQQKVGKIHQTNI
jgi:hypothetical protein